MTSSKNGTKLCIFFWNQITKVMVSIEIYFNLTPTKRTYDFGSTFLWYQKPVITRGVLLL